MPRKPFVEAMAVNFLLATAVGAWTAVALNTHIYSQGVFNQS